jgi:nitrogen regulatory protein P-II 1
VIRVECICRPNRLDAVIDALDELGVYGATVTDVRGYGKQKGHGEVVRPGEFSITLIPKVRIEAVVDDEEAEAVMEAMARAARSGEIGDGKIFCSPVGDAMRIRTGERGPDIL